MDSTPDYATLISDLERQELQSVGGMASPQIYGQLLAIYLLCNDLPNAKLLWKRIPANVKTENPELSHIWEIGIRLWNRDLPTIYPLLASYEWPNHLKNVMKCIGETTRKRALNLISKGFTSISLDEVIHYIGLSKEETIEKIRSLGWTIDMTTNFVIPSKISNNVEELTSSEEQLAKLTEYVAFLEN
ncbi:COP9 signalosome complex subunit 8-like [Oppia nitens]|uniref:COP9 signalosome complex subunit 8-like n=1 Tax=Oppia nitens TaxID=1686743 RepID=UPI0023DCAC49|nr:COP9 signalosome complex subunit 8-like [Oppia nitens]